MVATAGISSQVLEPLAVVGVGCRFPGGVRDLDTLGGLLTAGTDVIGEVPADRWAREFCDPRLARPGTTSSHVGAFLDDIDRCDAAYFGISPREARALDPQQRLLLEVGWEAMSDSGRPREAWQGTRTAVFVGMLAGDYTVLHAKTLGVAGIGPHYASGTEFSFGAGRLAYVFDLHGPVATLNSACSSSLLAVHLAGQSLRAGECDIALAGGVNLLVTPELSIFMSRIGAISPTGRCRPFDTAADGVVRGEGCGFVVLKRLSDALTDGDRVYATIRGSAINHDGYSMGLTVPNGAAQADVLRTALAHAGLGPEGVDYVEAHGTGTPLGDYIELNVLADVYGSGRPADRPLLIGSHKALFGHTDAVAGIAGLLKAIWVANASHAPAQPHLDELIPAVDWQHAGIAVPTAGTDLPGLDRPVRVGVSAFGLSGTNAHVILESPPATKPAQLDRPGGSHVLLVSAPHRDLLADQVAQMRARVADAGDLGEDYLEDLVASAATRRTHETHRYAVVAADRRGLVEGLDGFGNRPVGTYEGTVDPDEVPTPVFVYSGQGCQWPGMAIDLYERVPTIRDTLDECDALIRQHVPWSLVDELRRTRDSRLADTDLAQPAIFAVQVALSRWWAECGVTPTAVVGHSVGEVAAAHVAGCLSLADAVRLIVQRGLILHETAGAGRMVAVQADQDRVREVLAGTGLPVVIATVNGPTSVVIAGPPEAAAEASRALERRGLRCVPLRVDYAFHSPVVAGCGPRLRAALADLTPTTPTVRLLSSVHPLTDVTAPDAAYWERNLTDPVLLWPAVDRLLAERDHAVVEVSPHPVLTRPLLDAVRRRDRRGPVVSTLRRNEPGLVALHKALAELHVAGIGIDWERVTGRPRQYRSLPVPSWGGDRYWLPGVKRGQQTGAAVAAPATVRLSLLDAAGQVISEMIAEPVGGTAQTTTPPAEPPVVAGPPVESSPAGVVAAPAGSPATPSPATPMVDRVDAAVRRVLGLGSGQSLPRRRGLFELGLDSLTAVELRTQLEAELGVALSSTVAFEYPTVEALAAHLAELAPALDAGPAPAVTNGPVGSPDRHDDRAVAVVGLACRLPGAASVDEFWTLLREGRHAIGELPSERRRDPSWSTVGPDVPTRGGYLDDVAGFDAAFFRISPREARSLDPQQRLFLEVAWEALEDAGLAARSLEDRPIGVYLGMNTADYQQLLTRDMGNVDLYYGTGTSFAAAGGRLSYFLGVHGPSMVVDTACSASLTAVHLACQGLRDGDCEVAIVGGANAIVAPTVSLSMSAGGALAPDGRCKTFDEAADGYGRAEGAAVLILKPLAAAVSDGDQIYAVVRGSAVNQDGASGGLTVPSAAAQTAVIRQALNRAGWAPHEVDYVEAHGTGTPLGDPIEVRALAEALGPGRSAQNPVLVGSIKANIGHLEAAAGVTGLLKAILSVYHGEIPTHLVTQPSSRIDWDRLPVALATTHRGWPDRGRTRRAGVSAFGFSGSNAHVLVEQAPAPAGPVPTLDRAELPYVLPVTAASATAVQAVAGRMADRLRAAAPGELDDIVYTAAYRRSWLDHRVAVVGADATQLAAALEAVAAGELPARARRGHVPGGAPRKIALWYGDDLPTGQLSARLVAVPGYAQALETCSEQLVAITGTHHDVSGEPPAQLRRVWVFSHHVAATRVWASVGVSPDAVVGVGTGEVSAAWAAGQLTMTDALRLLAGQPTATALQPAQVTVVSAAGEQPATDMGELARRAGMHSPATQSLGVGERCADRLTAAGLDAAVEVTLHALPGPVAARLGVLDPGGDPLERIALTAAELLVTGSMPARDIQALPHRRLVSLPSYPWERRRYWYRELPPAETDAPDDPDERLFTIGWEQVDQPADRSDLHGTWAVLGSSVLAKDLATALESRGCTVARPDGVSSDDRVAEWRRSLDALGTAFPDCQGVILVADPDTASANPAEPSVDMLDALALGQAMAALPRAVGRLWFVTQGAHDPVGTGDVYPPHTAVWEIGRVLAVELPGRWGGLVDVTGDAEAVIRALSATTPDDQVCVRDGTWYAARLARAQAPTGLRDGADADRWHLVVGGAAARAAARVLVQCGARHLLLVGGEPPSPAEVGGEFADVIVDHCTLEELDAKLPALGAVGEVIAVATPAPTIMLQEVSEAEVGRHLADAAALVRACTAVGRYQPQRLTVVTSAGPSWGSVNTAASAAATGWLSGWARAGRTTARSSLLGLMPRADTAELSAEHQALFGESGLRLLTTDDTEAVLRQAVLGGPSERCAAVVDLDRYVRLCQDLAPRTFLAGFTTTTRATAAFGTELLALPETARRERLLDHVSGVVADVLDLPADELDPEAGFFDLGMDSVMALRVRTCLEDDLSVELSSTLTFEYPTTVRLAEHLAGLLAGPSNPPPQPFPDQPAAPAPAPTSTDAPDDELLRALEQAMAAAELQLGPERE